MLFWSPCLALALCLPLAPGCGGGSGPRFEYPPEVTQSVRPSLPQTLAFATTHEIGVLAGERTQVIGHVPSGRAVKAFQWSGDGRVLAWVLMGANFKQWLTVHDLDSGQEHTWSGSSYDSVAPSLHGVTVGSYEGYFTEFEADGSEHRYPVTVPGRHEEVKPLDPADSAYTGTDVSLALPLHGGWFVAAENQSRFGAHGGPHRLYDFDPARDKLTLAGRAGYAPTLVTRIDENRAMWVDVGSGGACDPYAALEGYGTPVPKLPTVEGGSWELRRLLVAKGRVDVLARRLRGGFLPGSSGCTPDPRLLEWLSYYDGRWHRRGTNLADVAIAADGTIARSRARITGFRAGDSSPVFHYSGASVMHPDGTSTKLPRDTTRLLFGPTAQMTLRHSSGHGPPLTSVSRLGEEGAGALRFGADPAAMQAATDTPLRFSLDESGCGTVRPLDEQLDRHMGLEGHLVRGRLDWLSVSSLDVAASYDAPALSTQQPDVSSIKTRGPAAPNGARVGQSVDALVSGLGTPAATRPGAPGKRVLYSFRVGERTLVGQVDAGGTVRRLEWRTSDTRARCHRRRR